MIEHAHFGQRSSLCLCGRHGASLFATATSLLLLLGSVATAAAAEAPSSNQLPGTSWTTTSVQGQDVPADVIPLLRFREPYDYDDLPASTMYLDAVFSPCFDVDLLYKVITDTVEGEMKTLLQITDKPSDCTACMSASERAACRNPWYKPDDQSQKDALVDASQSFFDALMQAKSFTITTGVLELRDALGVTVMQLVSCETESELAGTLWHPYLKFQGCSLRGDLGCNSFGADYKTNASADPPQLLLRGTGSTEIGCEEEALELAYLAALERVTAYKLTNNATHQLLDLIDAKTGDTLLSYTKAPTARGEGLSQSSSTRLGDIGGGLIGLGFSWIVTASLCMSNGPSIVTTATYLLLLSLLGSVATAAAAEASSADQLIGTSWTAAVVQGQDVPVDVIPLLRFREPSDWDDLPAGTMRLEAAFSPCFYSMELLYTVDTSTVEGDTTTPLKITDTSSICPGCTPASEIARCPWYNPKDQSKKDMLVDASQSFFNALMQATSFTLNTDGLELHDELGVVIMELISCERESQLSGTGWHPYMIYPTDSPAISLTQQQQQTMSAKFQGCSVGGNSGCNTYNADYKTNATVDPPEILFGGITSTEMGCLGDVMSIESAYTAALGKSTGFKLSANEESLDLFDAKTGNTLLSFVPCVGPESILGVMWEANGIRNTARNTGTTMKMTFQDNGMVKGQTACREYGMEYAYDSDLKTISIATPESWDPPSETACDRDDFDEDFQHENAIEQEKALLEALEDIASFDVVLCSGTLRLKDAAGQVVLGLRMVDPSSDPDADVSRRGNGLTEISSARVGVVNSGLGGFAWIVPLLAALLYTYLMESVQL